jgi:anaerobic selenocysteine-containing dehydrogenase
VGALTDEAAAAPHTRTCTLCEAGCALEITPRAGGGMRVRGDRLDVLSAGYLCPKGSVIAELDADPDRLRRPLVRRAGRLVETSWDEAFDEIHRRLPPIQREHGRDAVALFIGNPTAHNLSAALYLPQLARALGTRNRYSPASIDTWPQQVASLLVFGDASLALVPDLDRTDLLVVVGANPRVSNGSMAVMPNWPGRLDAIVERGSVVVVDPRRTETAKRATDHLAVRPGGDAFLLLAIIETVLGEGLVQLGAAEGLVSGLEDLRRFVAPFTPEAAAEACGIDAGRIRALARSLATTPRAAVYGRVGANLQEHGLAVCWALNVLNLITGNVDAVGGVAFPRPATGLPASRSRPRPHDAPAYGRWHSRVRGYPEVLGELPVVTLLDEITTPGPGQVRAMITHSANPVISVPGGAALGRALAALDFMVSVDVYLNETTRHADVVLPAPPVLSRSYYPFVAQNFGVRAYAKYSRPVTPLSVGQLDDWEIILRLVAAVGDDAAHDGVAATDEALARHHAQRLVAQVAGSARLSVNDVLASCRHVGPERLVDLYLRAGPYGDHFGGRPGGLTLDAVAAAPHGIDFGPPPPQLADLLRTASGRVELLPAEVAAQRSRLVAAMADARGPGLLLIGRRQLQSNNSWMHNVRKLVGGRNRCTVLVNPHDAAARGIADGSLVMLTTAAGALTLPCELTDDVGVGVVCVPHGWGHGAPDVRLGVAATVAGASVNDIVPAAHVEVATGAAAVNGVPVELAAAQSAT